MNDVFYAVCQNGGATSLSHKIYKTLKAVFFDKKEAEDVVARNPGIGLYVEPVYITAVGVQSCLEKDIQQYS